MYEDNQHVERCGEGILAQPCMRQVQSGQNRHPPALAIARVVVEQIVALAFDIPAGDLRAPTRCRAPVAFARQVAMYLMHVACGQSLTDIGGHFGRDRTTVAYACGLIEDRRDDPAFDVSLERLERAIVRLTQAVAELKYEAGS